MTPVGPDETNTGNEPNTFWMTVKDVMSDECPCVLTAMFSDAERSEWARNAADAIATEIESLMPRATPSRDDFNADALEGWNACRDYLLDQIGFRS